MAGRVIGRALTALAVAAALVLPAAAPPRAGGVVNVGEKQSTQTIWTNTPTPITIRGATQWAPKDGGVRVLGLYANVHLPTSARKRKALARGGWVAYFEQTSPADQTGFVGPVPISRFGGPSVLIAHTWAHGVTPGRGVRFMLLVQAFDYRGRPMRFPLTIGTRNVRIT